MSVAGDGGDGKDADFDGREGPAVEYSFAAAFVHLRSVTLEERSGARVLMPGEVVSNGSGHYWLVDPQAGDVKIYGPGGQLLHVLRGRSRLADLCAPVSLATLHGSWIAVLDAGAGCVKYYDARARYQGGFDLPQVDDPHQVRNLGDHHLAIVGPGGSRHAHRLVHLYRLDGRYSESVFCATNRTLRETAPAEGPGMTRRARAPVQAAAAGRSILLAYAPAQSVTLYDFATRIVRSFPLKLDPLHQGDDLTGLFPAPGNRVVLMHRTAEPVERYAYSLYTSSGEVLRENVRSPQRLVGVEGRLFFSIGRREEERGLSLRICRLRETE